MTNYSMKVTSRASELVTAKMHPVMMEWVGDADVGITDPHPWAP